MCAKNYNNQARKCQINADIRTKDIADSIKLSIYLFMLLMLFSYFCDVKKIIAKVPMQAG